MDSKQNLTQDNSVRYREYVATGIATRQRTKKENVFTKIFGVATIFISGKLWKTMKIRQVCGKTKFLGSRVGYAEGMC